VENVFVTRRKLLVGLVGGIGSGKSSVAAVLQQYGGRIIDADQLGHQALCQPAIHAAIVQRWGNAVLDDRGAINRRQLAEVVFTHPEERKALEALVHPWIGQAIRAAAEKALHDPSCRFVVLDAAIMLEAGWSKVCDKLIYVQSPPEQRLQRVARQRGWTAQDMQKRELAQLPLTEKAARADHILENTGSFEELHQQVEELLRCWHLLEPYTSVSPPGDANSVNP
jgi:dephospho-CoA kinase